MKEIRDIVLENAGDTVKENIDQVKEAYRLVVKMAYICREVGLLALEEEAGSLSMEVPLRASFIKMVQMIVDGTDPKIISEVLTIKCKVNKYTGIEGILYYAYARSILLIQAAETPYNLELFFNALIPDDVMPFDEQQKIVEKEKQRLEKSGFFE